MKGIGDNFKNLLTISDLWTKAEAEINFYKTLPDRWITKINGYKASFQSLKESSSPDFIIPTTDSKLFNLNLGFDFAEIKKIFGDYKVKIISTITNEIANLVKEQGVNLIKSYVESI